MRALAWSMTALFALAAAVQWNDPDPLRWVAFYLLAACASLGIALGRTWSALEIASAGSSAVVVAILLLPALGPGASPRIEAFTSFRMRSPADEQVRELAGAAIALGWSATLVARRRLKSSSDRR
jgi:hypothetical protein